MLAVQARALTNYFLIQDSNQNQPANFIPNKVSGILFENKVDRKHAESATQTDTFLITV